MREPNLTPLLTDPPGAPPTLDEQIMDALIPFARLADAYNWADDQRAADRLAEGMPPGPPLSNGHRVTVSLGECRRARAALARLEAQRLPLLADPVHPPGDTVMHFDAGHPMRYRAPRGTDERNEAAALWRRLRQHDFKAARVLWRAHLRTADKIVADMWGL